MLLCEKHICNTNVVPKSCTKAVGCIPQIITFLAMKKEMGHKQRRYGTMMHGTAAVGEEGTSQESQRYLVRN